MLVLLAVPTGTALAQESLISVKTDDINYDEGDTIVISGSVKTMIQNTPVLLQVLSSTDLIYINQIGVAQDGSFSHTLLAEGVIKNAGEYTVKVAYQEHVTQTTFTFTPKSEVVETSNNYEVNAGSHGTFDVPYTIRGGTVSSMEVNFDEIALVVKITAEDEGRISLDLPRDYVGAEMQNGRDDVFIILIGGNQAEYTEAVQNTNSRFITVNFEEGDTEITVIGTYIVPEFGAVALAILVAGVLAVTVMARGASKSGIMPGL